MAGKLKAAASGDVMANKVSSYSWELLYPIWCLF